MGKGEFMGVMAIVGFFVFIIGLLLAFNVWVFGVIEAALTVGIIHAIPPTVILAGIDLIIVCGLISWVVD